MRRSVSILLIAVVVAGLWTAGWLGRQTWPGQPANMGQVKDASPAIVFVTVALGGFRGLIADLLWFRISDLQERGRYFEVVQLAGWITKLEPYSTEVWAYHAWNMAYNISIMFPTPLDRWRWVKNGVALLRDEGLRLNPDAPRLHWELAWIYQHKIGSHWDDFSPAFRWYYARAIDRAGQDGDSRTAGQAALPPRAKQFMQAYDVGARFDWRAPETAAAYWAWQGLLKRNDFQARQCARMLMFTMLDIHRRGVVYCDATARLYVRIPNFACAGWVEAAGQDMIRRFGPAVFDDVLTSLHEDTILFRYAFPGYVTAGTAAMPTAGQVEQVIARRLRDQKVDRVREIVQELLIQHYGTLEAGDLQLASGFKKLADGHIAFCERFIPELRGQGPEIAAGALAKYKKDREHLRQLLAIDPGEE